MKGDASRRVFDLAVAGTAGTLLSPVMAVVALLVRLRLGSPVLFRQRRSGRHGVEFTIYKFRTMRPETFPGESDRDRDTPLGRALRHTSLDELPQLWNVARGDMSIIGPRPTLPEQVVHYTPRQRGRLDVRPGITGWAQVNGRNSLSWPQRIELDLEYIRRRCLKLDGMILLRSAAQVLKPKHVYGPGGINPGISR